MLDRTFAILPGDAEGPVLALTEALSFWGGVDPETGRVMDVYHPAHGASLTGTVLAMATSRGSCSGSGVILDLILSGRAPAALAFSEPEDVLTLGALVASGLFGRTLPVYRLSKGDFATLCGAAHAKLTPEGIVADGVPLAVAPADSVDLRLSPEDAAMLAGERGEAVAQAMRILCAVARQQGAEALTDVSRAHIDGCIYAHDANLRFAETMEALGARVAIPTTMNAISVDHAGWRDRGVPPSFGGPAARLADAYVRMGCQPTFTCAPYLLPDAPAKGEAIGWAESNAVIYANTVLGARTSKHPDFLDLCIAMTGRAPLAGVYLAENRRARRVVEVEVPEGADDAFWPLLGYLTGSASPEVIPILHGLEATSPTPDDLKALCAAFGTTSAAPMLHIRGVTPEAETGASEGSSHVSLGRVDMEAAWMRLNAGAEAVDLVAIGSPHASLTECRAFADALDGRPRSPRTSVILTVGRGVRDEAARDGTLTRLRSSGVDMIPDLCWCSITPPVFPDEVRTVITNSGKYAHYGPGLSNCSVRLGTLEDCVEATLTGRAPSRLPHWLA